MMKNTVKIFAVIHLGALISGLLTIICMATVWLYWQKTLDTCPEGNCGCFLYGKWTYSTFSGGNTIFCRFVTLSPIPTVLWSFIMLIYYSLKLLRNKWKENYSTQGKHVRYQEQMSKNPSKVFLMTSALTSLAIVILIFTTAIIVTDGYYKTCLQYRKSVIDQLSASGAMTELVLNRLSCIAITDFMDYLQPDPANLEYKFRRYYRINTGAPLVISLLSIWLHLLCFLIIFTFNIRIYWKYKPKYSEELQKQRKLNKHNKLQITNL